MPRILYAILGFALVVAALISGGSLVAYFDLTSLLLVLGGGTLFCAAQHGFLAFFHALGVGETMHEAHEINAQICVLQSARNTFCGVATVGFLIGLVSMLQNLADPAAIGPAMAVTILTVLYGLFISEVLIAPRISALLGRVHGKAQAGAEPPLPSDGARSALTLMCVCVSQLAIFATLSAIML